MKKLLLGLGTLSLIALPVLTIISCSSTTTPTLNTEAAKLKNMKSILTAVTPQAAMDAINGAADKDAELNKFYKRVGLATGFTYTYTSSAVNTTTNTTLDVTVKISETDNTEKKDVTFAITGFSAVPTKDSEAIKLVTKESLLTAGTAAAAMAAINGASGAENAEFIKYYANIPLASGFTYAYTSSAVNANNTILNVTVTITEASDSSTKEVVIEITGFLAEVPTLDTEAAKLVTKESLLKSGTAAAAMAAIDGATAGIDRNKEFDKYYSRIDLATGFTYTYTSSKVNTTTDTTLDVTVTIVKAGNAIPKIIVIEITGFSVVPTLDTEAGKLVTKVSKISNVTALAAKTALDSAESTSASAAKTALETFYTDIPLATGFSYAYKSSVVDTTTNTTLNVTVTITEASDSSIKEVVIAITGFPAPTLNTEAAKITNQTTLSSSETANQAQAAINSASGAVNKDTVFKTYYAPKEALANGFTYTWEGSTVVDSTTLEAQVKVSEVGTSNEVTKDIQVTGFSAAPTKDTEAARLTTETTILTAGTAAAAMAAINGASGAENAEFIKYYAEKTLATGFTYAYKSSVVNANNTILDVTVTITLANGGKTDTLEYTIAITGFTAP